MCPQNDTEARLGGDEFVVLCENDDGELDHEALIGRINAAFEKPMAFDGTSASVGLSIGCATT